MADSYKLKLAQSALSAENLLYIENKYLSYVHEDLDNELRQTFFNDYIEDASVDSAYKTAEQIATEYALTQPSLDVSSGPSYALNTHQLIQDYRRYGHYYCNCGYFKSPDISKSLNLADNIKYIYFEFHHDILDENRQKMLFKILNKNKFYLKDKFINSFYFAKK